MLFYLLGPCMVFIWYFGFITLLWGNNIDFVTLLWGNNGGFVTMWIIVFIVVMQTDI